MIGEGPDALSSDSDQPLDISLGLHDKIFIVDKFDYAFIEENEIFDSDDSFDYNSDSESDIGNIIDNASLDFESNERIGRKVQKYKDRFKKRV